jgi:hypothetical protein
MKSKSLWIYVLIAVMFSGFGFYKIIEKKHVVPELVKLVSPRALSNPQEAGRVVMQRLWPELQKTNGLVLVEIDSVPTGFISGVSEVMAGLNKQMIRVSAKGDSSELLASLAKENFLWIYVHDHIPRGDELAKLEPCDAISQNTVAPIGAFRNPTCQLSSVKRQYKSKQLNKPENNFLALLFPGQTVAVFFDQH